MSVEHRSDAGIWRRDRRPPPPHEFQGRATSAPNRLAGHSLGRDMARRQFARCPWGSLQTGGALGRTFEPREPLPITVVVDILLSSKDSDKARETVLCREHDPDSTASHSYSRRTLSGFKYSVEWFARQRCRPPLRGQRHSCATPKARPPAIFSRSVSARAGRLQRRKHFLARRRQHLLRRWFR